VSDIMQELWGKRVAAFIIDMVIVTLLLWVVIAIVYPLIALANIFSILSFWIILAAILIIGYFTFFEGKYGASLGKIIMRLKVKALQGKMDYKKAFIRNLSKILWVPMIVDLIIGFAGGSPRDRYLNRLAKTEVVGPEEVDKTEIIVDRSAS
jgi:uncharacterized RDD family membrane protein YckC